MIHNKTQFLYTNGELAQLSQRTLRLKFIFNNSDDSQNHYRYIKCANVITKMTHNAALHLSFPI
jgi:hypothetical protein